MSKPGQPVMKCQPPRARARGGPCWLRWSANETSPRWRVGRAMIRFGKSFTPSPGRSSSTRGPGARRRRAGRRIPERQRARRSACRRRARAQPRSLGSRSTRHGLWCCNPRGKRRPPVGSRRPGEQSARRTSDYGAWSSWVETEQYRARSHPASRRPRARSYQGHRPIRGDSSMLDWHPGRPFHGRKLGG